MPKYYYYEDDYMEPEEGHCQDISWEELQEMEYEDEDNAIDIRYPETYC